MRTCDHPQLGPQRARLSDRQATAAFVAVILAVLSVAALVTLALESDSFSEDPAAERPYSESQTNTLRQNLDDHLPELMWCAGAVGGVSLLLLIAVGASMPKGRRSRFLKPCRQRQIPPHANRRRGILGLKGLRAARRTISIRSW